MRRVLFGLLVVLVLGGAFAAWQIRKGVERANVQARETALRDNLSAIRKAIQNFHSDKGRYPHSLSELTPNYLRTIPIDPMTKSANWRLTTEETVQVSSDFATPTAPRSESVIIDVHSGAPGYSEY